jgi:uncharacterized protein YjdB
VRSAAFCATAALLAGVLFVQACTSREIVLVVIGSVSVAPPAASLLEGESLQFSALIMDDRGATVSDADVEWSTDDPQILSITSDGIVEALQEGQARIRAAFLGVSGEAIVNVHRAP